MKNSYISFVAVTAFAALSSGCSFHAQLGQSPTDPPPQLLAGTQRDINGRVVYEWSRPSAFGKVSGRQKVLGDATCLMARVDLEAFGHHPSAKDADGVVIPGGGYFCMVKAQGERPAEQAPRLVRSDGVLGWNEPRLFGAVPAEQQARGNALCAQAQTGFEAAAYHPSAQDETGQAILGGGFFCAPKRPTARALGWGEVPHKLRG
jgi:hypothetical protein